MVLGWRDRRFDASGFADTPEGVARRANKEKWMRRKTRVRGTWLNVIHVTSLPARAFDALIARILDLPDIDETAPLVDVMPPPPMPRPLRPTRTPRRRGFCR